MAMPPAAARELRHKRTITIEGYRRHDGLWEVEGHLVDCRTAAVAWPGGGRGAGVAIHDMTLRLTVDAGGLIVAVAADTAAGPYPDVCGSITPAYERLVGLRVAAGFRGQVQRLLSGTRGCTHLTELLGALATGVVQTLAGDAENDPQARPFQLEGCHAFLRSGEVVARHFPRWYLTPVEDAARGEARARERPPPRE